MLNFLAFSLLDNMSPAIIYYHWNIAVQYFLVFLMVLFNIYVLVGCVCCLFGASDSENPWFVLFIVFLLLIIIILLLLVISIVFPPFVFIVLLLLRLYMLLLLHIVLLLHPIHLLLIVLLLCFRLLMACAIPIVIPFFSPSLVYLVYSFWLLCLLFLFLLAIIFCFLIPPACTWTWKQWKEQVSQSVCLCVSLWKCRFSLVDLFCP